MAVRRGRVLLILCYFGRFGPWFPLYLQSLAKQHTIDLLLVSDVEPPVLPPNARRIEMRLEQLRELAAERLDTSVRLHRIRNVCDLKPAYGIVFEAFTRDYDYWAFGDADMFYGDIDQMLGPHLDGTVDLVVPGTNAVKMQGKIQGPLTVLRNRPGVTRLAIEDPAFKQVLESREHWAYDESSWRYGSEISSFSRIVKQAEARGDLSIQWGIPSVTHVPWRGRWYAYDGRSLREDNGNALLYYHWGKMRHRKLRWPTFEEAENGFAFDRYGFYDVELGRARQAARRAVGRAVELAGDTRTRLSKWRAARRASPLPAGSQTQDPEFESS